MSVRRPGHRRALTRPAGVLVALALATAGLAAAAPPAAATGSQTATGMRVSPAQTTRTVGTSIRFTWTLTSYGTPVAGVPVEVYRKAKTATTWTKIGTYATNSSGQVSSAFTVQRTTETLAKFLGNAKYASAYRAAIVYAEDLGQRAVTEASHHAGAPYQWGAAGPSRFDCSGFTLYVFGRLGKSLPHNSGQQYGVVRHVTKTSRRVGDLIFVYNSGGIYHVGIYAGNGYMWHSPHTGDVVKKSKIWSSTYYVGRVG